MQLVVDPAELRTAAAVAADLVRQLTDLTSRVDAASGSVGGGCSRSLATWRESWGALRQVLLWQAARAGELSQEFRHAAAAFDEVDDGVLAALAESG